MVGFVTILTFVVVSVAIVDIDNTLHASYIQLTPIIVTYELSFGLLLITGGRFGDLLDHRRTYRIGTLCFKVSSVFCGLSANAGFLIVDRFLQGLSAAVLFPQIYASIRADFDDTDARKAFGYLGMTLGVAAVTDQILGGLLISINFLDLQWRTIFFINVPIGMVALYFSRQLKNVRPMRKQSLDWIGIALSSIGISIALLPLLMISVWSWNFRSNVLLLTGLFTLYFFAHHENRYAATDTSHSWA
ncbi:hypothetical protein WS69_12370 [Burkholderia sp. BDU5]|nr:hypothetical protein WS69_12370 [Burkholderia sp. BDU5]